MLLRDNIKEINSQFLSAVQYAKKHIKDEATSRSLRASNELRNSALRVLRGQRHGRIYRVPHTKVSYRASKPGEPPAVRTGALRLSWGILAQSSQNGVIKAGIYSGVKYADILEYGGGHIAARPFAERIATDAAPQIIEIYRRPYFR